jgi:diguanylate cyclase (GGDEF)-like protein
MLHTYRADRRRTSADDGTMLEPATRSVAAGAAPAHQGDAIDGQVLQMQQELERLRLRLAPHGIDAMTGLADRTGLERALATALGRAQRRPSPLCLVMLDLDHTARINTVHGRDQGDRTIRAVGATLAGTARRMDLVARSDGQEFSVVLYDCPLPDAERWAGRFRLALLDHVPALLTPITASFGVVEAAVDDDAVSVLRRARRAVDQAKRSGRDRVVTAAVLGAVRPGRRTRRRTESTQPAVASTE